MPVKTPAVLEYSSGFSLGALHLDDLREDEALVKIEAVGVCATDLHIKPSFYPAVKGHEGCGRIEALGSSLRSAGEYQIGDRVVLSYAFCGKMQYCVECNSRQFAGKRTDGSVLAFQEKDGSDIAAGWFGQSSFSKFTIAHVSSMIKLPDFADSIPSEILAPLGCGFQTGAGSIYHVLKPGPDTTIAICGVGSVGLAALMMAKYMQSKCIIAIDRDAGRLDLAMQLGATKVLSVKDDVEEALISRIVESAENDLTMVFDSTGLQKAIRPAMLSLEPGGMLCSVASLSDVTFNPVEIFAKGRTWTGNHQGESDARKFIPQLIRLYLDGHFPIDRLIKTYKAEHIGNAIDDMKKGTTIKPVLIWED